MRGAAVPTLEEIRLESADPRAVRVRLSAFERVSHQLTEQLVRLLVAERFAVPDRTELYRVGSRIDYAVDHLESVGRLIEIHRLTAFPDELLHLIRLAADAAWCTAQGLTRVRSPEVMPPYWRDLQRLSQEADLTSRNLYARHFGTDCPADTAALREISTETADVTHLLDASARTMRGVVERWRSIA
ncbi:hypothetical protein [Nocardia sp. NPDC004722]